MNQGRILARVYSNVRWNRRCRRILLILENEISAQVAIQKSRFKNEEA